MTEKFIIFGAFHDENGKLGKTEKLNTFDTLEAANADFDFLEKHCHRLLTTTGKDVVEAAVPEKIEKVNEDGTTKTVRYGKRELMR